MITKEIVIMEMRSFEIEIKESFEDFSEKVEDPRLTRNRMHSMEEILFLTLCALICGCEGWRDIERFGKMKLSFLKTIFPYENGTPSDDTLRRFYRALDPKTLQSCFVQWTKTLNLTENKHIAIDGKVSRRSFDENQNPLNMVSAFAGDSRIVLGQEKVTDKSNEITAIPKLLELLDVSGSVVTIDAMGCQKKIANLICEKKADYVLSLKGNQSTLKEDVKLLFEDEELLKTLESDTHQTIDGSEHGRVECRNYRTISMPESLKKEHQWTNLNTVVEVKSRRDIKGKTTEETRYYISSLANNAQRIGLAIRSHWGIENSLHWILDVSFGDDQSRIRKGNAPQNMAMMKHFTLNLLQQSKEKRGSIKQMRKAAGWDNNYLLSLLQKI